MFPNQNFHRTLAPLPSGRLTNNVKVTDDHELDTFNMAEALENFG
jgi:hypothetical protein